MAILFIIIKCSDIDDWHLTIIQTHLGDLFIERLLLLFLRAVLYLVLVCLIFLPLY